MCIRDRKAGLTVANLDPWFAADCAVVVEEEQPDVVLLGVPVDMNLIRQRVTWRGKIILEGELAPEQPVHTVTLVQEIGSHIGDEHEVGLARLDEYPCGHPSLSLIH